MHIYFIFSWSPREMLIGQIFSLLYCWYIKQDYFDLHSFIHSFTYWMDLFKNIYWVPVRHQLYLIYWEYRSGYITLLIYKELISLQLFIKNFPFLGERGTHLFIWFYCTNHASYHLIFPDTFPFRWYIYSKQHKPVFASLTAKARLTNGIDAWLE